MATASKVSQSPPWMFWTGWVVSVLPALALILSAIMKFTNSPQLAEGMGKLGWDAKLAVPLGITELACAILYLIPQTSVLGAILLTGFMGGAIATHVRVGDPFIVQALIGVLAWLGLYLRDPRLRALIPWKS